MRRNLKCFIFWFIKLFCLFAFLWCFEFDENFWKIWQDMITCIFSLIFFWKIFLLIKSVFYDECSVTCFFQSIIFNQWLICADSNSSVTLQILKNQRSFIQKFRMMTCVTKFLKNSSNSWSVTKNRKFNQSYVKEFCYVDHQIIVDKNWVICFKVCQKFNKNNVFIIS